MPVSAGDDEVGISILGEAEKLIGNGAFAAEKSLCTYADPVAAQIDGNVLDAPQAHRERTREAQPQ